MPARTAGRSCRVMGACDTCPDEVNYIPLRRLEHMTNTHTHQSHPDIVKRLKRAEGHMRRVIAMFDEGRSCLELAQQLHAVEKAISEAKKRLESSELIPTKEGYQGAARLKTKTVEEMAMDRENANKNAAAADKAEERPAAKH